jgi:hypothetical protein
VKPAGSQFTCLACRVVAFAVVVFMALPSGLLESNPGRSGRPIVVFDGTLYRHKPDLLPYGIQPITIIYEGQLWPTGQNRDHLPEQDLVRRVALEAKARGTVAVLDIEHWPLRGDPAIVESSLTKYLTVLRWFQEAAPGLDVGYYGSPPLIDYWRTIQDPSSPDYRSWQTENNQLAPLAEQTSALFPSLYTFYGDRRGWLTYALAQITEARRYAGRKPVYAFLWPQYHESNRVLGGQYLDPGYWKLQLETAGEHADGIVIWGGWGRDGPLEWDEHAPWWNMTKAFLRTQPLVRLNPPLDVAARPATP